MMTPCSSFPGLLWPRVYGQHSMKRAIVVLLLVAWPAACSRANAADGPLFEEQVHGLLRTYCWKCHGGEAREAGLDLRSLPLIQLGGKSGPAVVAGNPDKSLLVRKIVAGEMPPGKSLKPSADHIEIIRAWVAGGARARYVGRGLNEAEEPAPGETDRDWWSFRPPVRVSPPDVQARHRVRTPVDAFVLHRLEASGLTLAPDAAPIDRIRRVYLDVLGVPPAPAEVDRFLADSRPGRWSRLVDRLLADARYGERWGRHWLDVAGYVDIIGSDNDAGTIKVAPGIWRYRDYVISAFNADKPFDEFLLEQLAGDELFNWREAEELTPAQLQTIVATGFLRNARDSTSSPELNTADIRHQVLYETLQTVSTSLLGLTIHCAQCHSHKFDPISQADYYRLAAIFTPTMDVQNWLQADQRHLHTVSPRHKSRIDAHNGRVDVEVARRKKRIAEIEAVVRRRLRPSREARVPEPVRADTVAAVAVPKEKRTAIQAYLAEKLGPLFKISASDIAQALSPEERREVSELQAGIATRLASKQSYQTVRVAWERGPAPPTYLYRRGDFMTPGPEVQPGVPVVLDPVGQRTVISKQDDASRGETSGRRLAFARWLTRRNHPVTARVIVNRLWMRYFSRGLVATPANFGLSGAEPTHPALLDWLACELSERGWSLKRIHRHVLLSSTYRQATSVDPATWDVATRKDPVNSLLWHRPLKRLESEAVRDSVLSVSGQLDARQGGPAIPIKTNPDSSVVVDTSKLARPGDANRRSLYLTCRRNYHPTELSVFDQPTVANNCTRRDSSAVVLQSLAMLNGAFSMNQARHLAARVVAETPDGDRRERVDHAFRLVLCRRATEEEQGVAEELLTRQAQVPGLDPGRPLEHLCHMLLNTNEFLYVP